MLLESGSEYAGGAAYAFNSMYFFTVRPVFHVFDKGLKSLKHRFQLSKRC